MRGRRRLQIGLGAGQELSGDSKVQPKYREVLLEGLALAALGTIADVVSLVGENRIIARHGLARLPLTKNAGLLALIESASLTGQQIDDYAVGFRLAPRLNAAGRMGHARLAVELLTRADPARAQQIAAHLEQQNRARQSRERKIARQAIDMVTDQRLDRDAYRGIVLAAEGWHVGVIGIVASRLVDRFFRPTVLIALENGVGQGSARSVQHFPMHEALDACREHLLSFGGHAMAAGLRIDPNAVEAFTEAFIEQANNRLTGTDLRPKLRLDAQIELDALTMDTVEAMQRLGPFGENHPKPRFATDWLDLAREPRCVGRNGEHLQTSFSQAGVFVSAIAFGQAAAIEPLKEHRRCRVAFEPIVNEYQDRRNVQLQVLDFQFPT